MIGHINSLSIIKEVDFGLYLDGGELGEILLPTRYVPETAKVGEKLDVFLYHDSEDRIIATTQMPYAMANECAYLKCIATNQAGAFLNWGLMKDLLVPFNQQKPPMQEGKSYMVYLFIDDQSGRITASARLDQFLFQDSDEDFKVGEEVLLINANKTDLGHKVIINHTHWGLLHQQEVSRPLKRGEQLKGFIKKIRDDGKIDVSMHGNTRQKLDDTAQLILNQLRESNGFLALNDKSKPQDIVDLLGMSKGLFKKSIGTLYKKKYIDIKADGIHLHAEAITEPELSIASPKPKLAKAKSIPKNVWSRGSHE